MSKALNFNNKHELKLMLIIFFINFAEHFYRDVYD